MRHPTKNIFWKDIPPGSRVIDRGTCYHVRLPHGAGTAMAYWGSLDAIEAQAGLARLAGRGRATRKGKRK